MQGAIIFVLTVLEMVGFHFDVDVSSSNNPPPPLNKFPDLLLKTSSSSSGVKRSSTNHFPG